MQSQPGIEPEKIGQWSVIEQSPVYLEKLALLSHSSRELSRLAYVLSPLSEHALKAKQRCSDCGGKSHCLQPSPKCFVANSSKHISTRPLDSDAGHQHMLRSQRIVLKNLNPPSLIRKIRESGQSPRIKKTHIKRMIQRRLHVSFAIPIQESYGTITLHAVTATSPIVGAFPSLRTALQSSQKLKCPSNGPTITHRVRHSPLQQ